MYNMVSTMKGGKDKKKQTKKKHAKVLTVAFSTFQICSSEYEVDLEKRSQKRKRKRKRSGHCTTDDLNMNTSYL